MMPHTVQPQSDGGHLKVLTPGLGGVGATSRLDLVVASLLFSTPPPPSLPCSYLSKSILSHCVLALARLQLATPVPD